MNDLMSPDQCEHEHWEVLGSNRIGCGSCRDCGRQVNLAVLFNNMRKRLDDAIKRAEAKAQ